MPDKDGNLTEDDLGDGMLPHRDDGDFDDEPDDLDPPDDGKFDYEPSDEDDPGDLDNDNHER